MNHNHPLANLPVVNRLKVVKELLLQKLDSLELQIQVLEGISQNLVENDSAVLETGIHLVNELQELRQESRQQGHLFAANFSKLLESLEIHDDLLKNLLYVSTQEQQRILAEILAKQENYNCQLSVITQQQKAIDDKFHEPIKIAQSSQELKDPETRLMMFLYSFLPSRYALDIGANRGDVTESLLQVGYKVYAFEPFPPVFAKLTQRFHNITDFRAYPLAIGATNETRDLHIAVDQTDSGIYTDSTFYNSLTDHSMPTGLVFTEAIPVAVKSLESLHRSLEIPPAIGLVKIDTEGFDLEVIRGMGDYRYSVVITEFWDHKFPFGQAKAFNQLETMVTEMKAKNYHWYIVIYRVWGSDVVSYYPNYPCSVENSWGNVFFFQDYQIFSQALMWCSAILPISYW